MRLVYSSFFKTKLHKDEEIIKLFSKLDSLLLKIVKVLSPHCTFIKHQILDYYIKVVAGHALHKTYYDKESSSRVGMSKRMKGGYLIEDRQFILKNINLLNVPFNSIVISKSNFNRFVFYTILAELFKIAEDYVDVSNEIAKGNLSLLKKKQEIEEKIGANSQTFYGALFQAKTIYDSFTNVRNTIITPYFRYVLAFAGKNKVSKEQTAENFQAGTLGLMRAVLLFNHKRGNSFGSYVKFWIKQSIIENVHDAFMIYLPLGTWTVFNKLEKFRHKAKTIEELAKLTKQRPMYIAEVYNRVQMLQLFNIEEFIVKEKQRERFLFEEPKNYSKNTISELITEDTIEDTSIFRLLSGEQRELVSLMFGSYSTIENTIDKNAIERERKRQLSIT